MGLPRMIKLDYGVVVNSRMHAIQFHREEFVASLKRTVALNRIDFILYNLAISSKYNETEYFQTPSWQNIHFLLSRKLFHFRMLKAMIVRLEYAINCFSVHVSRIDCNNASSVHSESH